MQILLAVVTGFLLDLLFGDPVWLYHPVRLMGSLIALLEKAVRRLAGGSKTGLYAGGGLLFAVVLTVSAVVPWAVLQAAERLCPQLAFALSCFWCYQILAARSLDRESKKVYERLKAGDLPGARKAVSMIVGRDTEMLDEAGVARAAVETVAENTSDGVTAPLLFLLIGGPALGFAYKAVNTMDSMIGYRDEKYRYIGFVAAKADDVLNLIPARLAAFCMMGAAFLLGMDVKNAWRIFRRDRYCHASPNSAQTEAVCAGALGLMLAGDAYYFGRLYHKKTIGDAKREICPEDILRASRLMYVTSLLTLLFAGGVRLLLVL